MKNDHYHYQNAPSLRLLLSQILNQTGFLIHSIALSMVRIRFFSQIAWSIFNFTSILYTWLKEILKVWWNDFFYGCLLLLLLIEYSCHVRKISSFTNTQNHQANLQGQSHNLLHVHKSHFICFIRIVYKKDFHD